MYDQQHADVVQELLCWNGLAQLGDSARYDWIAPAVALDPDAELRWVTSIRFRDAAKLPHRWRMVSGYGISPTHAVVDCVRNLADDIDWLPRIAAPKSRLPECTTCGAPAKTSSAGRPVCEGCFLREQT